DGALSAWSRLGNAGTVDTVNFIGTTDNVPFNIRVNNLRAGRIESANSQTTFFGYQAGNSGVQYMGTGFGYQALFSSTGDFNSALGYQALYSNTTGSYNTAVGNKALLANTTSNYNTALGYWALYSNTTGSSNTALGTEALSYNKKSSNNTALGISTLYHHITGSGNVAVGEKALYSDTSGYNNTSVGYYSLLHNVTGYENTALGNQSLFSDTTGHGNTAIGNKTLIYNVTGSENTAIGNNAGTGNTGVNFNQCTFVGSNSFPLVARTNVSMFGYGIVNAQCTADNQILLGNTAITSIRAQVSGLTSYSDARYKTNIKENVSGLDFIMKLKPVTYNVKPENLHKIWGTDESLLKRIDFSSIEKETFIGFLAQDVEKAAKESGFNFPGIDVPKNDKEVYALRYVDFIMPMVKGMQEQQVIIENQNKKIDDLQKQIDELKALIKK
ncbi:MAG: tail fiber domain-containing protein, partial [Bacteroidota bacterium]